MVQDNRLHHPSDAPDVIDLKTGAGRHLPQRLLPTSQGHPLSDQGVKLRISQLRGDCGCLMPRRAVPIRNRPETSSEQGEMRLKRRGNFAGVARRQTRVLDAIRPVCIWRDRRSHQSKQERENERAGAPVIRPFRAAGGKATRNRNYTPVQKRTVSPCNRSGCR